MGTDLDVYDGETGEIIQANAVEPSALSVITRAEVDSAIATAKQYPRSITRALKAAKTMAIATPEIAESCMYVLPARKGDDSNQPIEGPSVRLAEILTSAWGNIRSVVRITQESERFIVAQAVVHDLESNNAKVAEVRRTIYGRHGRYKEAMIAQTANAACSIAYRNAVFSVIPRALWDDIYRSAKRLASGHGTSIEEARKKNMEWAESVGVSPSEVFAFLGIHGLQDLTFEHLETLAGVRSSIKSGDTTVADVFHPQQEQAINGGGEAPRKIDRMKSDLKAKAEKAKAQPQPPTNPVPDSWVEGRE